jgi:hypothetical protein
MINITQKIMDDNNLRTESIYNGNGQLAPVMSNNKN